MSPKPHLAFVTLALFGCRPPADARTPPQPAATQPDVYTQTDPAPDGTGKVYMGRQIAQVMGHLGAGWLERGDREAEERTDLLLANLDLKPADVVADVGAGTGYFSFRIAPHVPQGKILAVDIQPEMLAMISAGEKDRKLTNVTPVLGTTTDPKLPKAGVDVVLLVDAYHEFDFPREMMTAITASLKPDGRVVLVEYRGEDPAVPIKPHHKMTQDQAKREMAAVGLKHIETLDVLPWQHLMVFGPK